MHRSHEYLAKIAVEICDGVLIHSLLGALKPGDIPADVRQEAIGTLIDNYFRKDTVIQAGYPPDMRYAGPREALLHALFRQTAVVILSLGVTMPVSVIIMARLMRSIFLTHCKTMTWSPNR